MYRIYVSAGCMCMCMYKYIMRLNNDSVLSVDVGEKLTDDEVDALLTGVEDSQGQVNYEGQSTAHSCNSDVTRYLIPLPFYCSIVLQAAI